MAFVSSFTPCTIRSRSRTTALTPRSAPLKALRPSQRVTMGLGEDGLKEDLAFAQNCIEEGCEVDAVQDVLTRLERRRAVLALELSQIEEVMAVLARENLSGDRGLVAEAMAAAVSIFSKADDNYPGIGDKTNAWTLDPIKEQPKF